MAGYEIWALCAVACVFLAGGVVKGGIGLGLPTVSIGLMAIWMPVEQAAGILIMVPFDSLFVLYIGATIFGLGFGGLVPMYAVALRSIYPPHSIGWRVGAIFLFGAAGMAIGGQFAGVGFDYMGTYRWAFAVGFAFNVINLMILATVMSITRRPGMDAAPAAAE